MSTWTLCSIQDPARALSEIHRVLKPGGHFYFLEHGLSREANVQKWQRQLNPLNQTFADGCRLDLDLVHVIKRANFELKSCHEFYLAKTPKTHGALYQGIAQRR